MAASTTHVVSDTAELLNYSKAIASLLRVCFPNKYPEESALTLEQSAGFHDLDDTTWVLLWRRRSVLATELIGLVAVAQYHAACYVFNLCIKPEYRRQGLALQLLQETAAVAVRNKTPALIGNVDANDQPLLRFYSSLGAEIDRPTGLGNGGAAQSTLRLTAVLPLHVEDVPAFFKQHALRRRMQRRQQQWWLIGAAAGAVALALAVRVQLSRQAGAGAGAR